MCVEIRELIIKATVSAGAGQGGSSAPAGSGDNNNVPANEELVNTCVEKILRILKDRNER